MKDSAKDLVDILVWKDQSKFTSKVALVPFAEDIRLPTTAALNAARGSGLAKTKTVGQKTYYLSDCVVERKGNQKYTVAGPGSNQYVMAHYTEEKTGSGNNQKGVCKVPSGSAIVPLSSDVDMLKSKIDGLTSDAATAGHLGTAWAWYTLSSNWNSLWPSSPAAADNTANLNKIAILMTDGAYNAQYDTNGILVNFDNNVSTNCPQAVNGCSTAQALALCSAMKQKKITVYTILFGQANNQTAVNTMKECARNPLDPNDTSKFYNAGDEVKLRQAFRDIALKLSSLYLSQ
jgi:hypothetical protein